MKTSFNFANSIMAGTRVFYGEPLMKDEPSKIVAIAYIVDAEISTSLFSFIALDKFS